MDKLAAIKSFAMTNMLLEKELELIEKRYSLDFGRNTSVSVSEENDYYPQFTQTLRAEAKIMSRHYEIFYCLEKSIRQLIVDVFENSGNVNWWINLVPQNVKENVEKSILREKEAAVTPRSTEQIDYTTFGELGEIIRANWALFGGGVFTDMKAMQKVMASLNALRNPIAHCALLAEDEEVRLKLTLRDWFRLIS